MKQKKDHLFLWLVIGIIAICVVAYIGEKVLESKRLPEIEPQPQIAATSPCDKFPMDADTYARCFPNSTGKD